MNKIKALHVLALNLCLTIVLAGACAVLTSGQTTLPPSLASLIPTATTTTGSGVSTTSRTNAKTGISSPSPTKFLTITTTDTAGHVESTIVSMGAQVTVAAENTGNSSTGALIGGPSPARKF
jgi:hypothetical protein